MPSVLKDCIFQSFIWKQETDVKMNVYQKKVPILQVSTILQAVETAVQMNIDREYGKPVPDYVEENVSTKVVKLIQSYTGVVNKMVWRKY